MVVSLMDDPAVIAEPLEADPPPLPPRRIAYRHRLPTRLWHWVNALTVFVMLMSGLMIFNAHPHLYWGKFGANFDHSWLSFHGRPIPGWATIPSTYNLAAARRWHLAFAWLLSAGLIAFAVTRLAYPHALRDLAPRPAAVGPTPGRHEPRAHARLRS